MPEITIRSRDERRMYRRYRRRWDAKLYAYRASLTAEQVEARRFESFARLDWNYYFGYRRA